MYNTLTFSVSDHIATISFNRPKAMNSFDNVMADELLALTDQVASDTSIRAVLLNGAGDLFMAGGDIRFFHASLDNLSQSVKKIVRTLNGSILNIMQMSKPVVASVHGSVAGVGMSFMMACDLAIAADDTKFTMAYSGIGICPDGGGTFNLPRLVGAKKAMEWILLSEIFDAHTAKEHGLINWVVPATKLQEQTAQILKRLAHGPTHSYAQTKQLINKTWDSSLEAQLEREVYAFASCTATRDFKVGVTSFLQKTAPEFTGS